MKYTLEICSDSFESTLIAQRAGADRVELIASTVLGGITPSYGLCKKVLNELEIPFVAMIRPRQAGFSYSKYDLDVMKEDIIALKELGVQGFVFGCLNDDGNINMKANEYLLKYCEGMDNVFHRAFDIDPDLDGNCKKLIDMGFKRVLTKGGDNKITDTYKIINELYEKYQDKLEFITGGVRENNIDFIKENLLVNQLHISSNKACIDKSTLANKKLFFGTNPNEEEGTYYLADEEYLKKVIKAFR